ncbi:hypothetical protein [uncultured Arthrobacter sp.]|uniref:hypothetical protein n=1 Tax=uncultured Arthrobacter sp. TaxID=114050 RepID=UPI00262282A9|nr:hypothetical protein [uncultured Arthrobacter sp.]
MSTDSVSLPASGGSSAASSNDHLTLDAVDTFEVSARLEASGVSDRTVRRQYGAYDVFDYAQSLPWVRQLSETPEVPGSWVGREALLGAARRGIVLILGAILGGLTATGLAVETSSILIAGVGAWVIGQAVSGMVWTHAGAGNLQRGIARGTGATVFVVSILACYTAVSLALPGHDTTTAALTTVWCLYSCVVSMLVILGRSWYLLIVLASAAVAMTLALVLGRDDAVTHVTLVAGTVVVAFTLALIAVLRTIDERRVPDRKDWKTAVAPAAQAGFLAAALATALTQLPDWEGTALIVATVVAAAATDPALVLMRQRLVWSSTHTPLLRRAAANAWFLTLGMSGAIVIVSAAVSMLVVLLLVEDTRTTTVLVAAAFSSLATTSTTLNAFGMPRGAVLFAGAACFAALVWIILGNALGALLTVVFLVAGIVMLLARVSDPRAYA